MLNTLTKYVSLTLGVLFVRQPTRTALGFLFGFVIRLIINLVSVWVFSVRMTVTDLSWVDFLVLGLFIAHLPTIRDHYFRHAVYNSENLETALAFIQELKVTEFEKQKYYFLVIEKILEGVEFSSETQKEIANMFARTKAPN